MPPRTIALIGAGCLTAGWLLASLVTPPVAQVQMMPDRRSAPPVAENELPAASSEQLQLKLRQAPPPPVSRRNPFVFASRDHATAAEPPPQFDPPSEAAQPPQPVGPIFALSGVGVTQTAEGAAYTAILSDGVTVHLAKVGDTIGGYKVVEVTETSVILAESSGAQHVLRLKH